jgi:hypothetical protein
VKRRGQIEGNFGIVGPVTAVVFCAATNRCPAGKLRCR